MAHRRASIRLRRRAACSASSRLRSCRLWLTRSKALAERLVTVPAGSPAFRGRTPKPAELHGSAGSAEEARDADPEFRGTSPTAALPMKPDCSSATKRRISSSRRQASSHPASSSPGVLDPAFTLPPGTHRACATTPRFVRRNKRIRLKLAESSQINASANRLKVHRPLSRG